MKKELVHFTKKESEAVGELVKNISVSKKWPNLVLNYISLNLNNFIDLISIW